MKYCNQDNSRYSGRVGAGIRRIFGWAIIGLMFVGLFGLLFGFIIKWLWNMLMPAIFGLGTITFWQAFGLVILTKLLFGTFTGSHRSYRRPWDDRDSPHGWHRPWRWLGERSESTKERFRDWKYYHQFWKEEGREAFEAYLDRKEQAKTADPERESGE